MHKRTFIIRNNTIAARAMGFIDALPTTPLYKVVVERADQRSLDQNAKMWPMLADVSKQVEWYGERLTPGEWKEVFTAGLKRSRVVPGIDGGFVVVGASTSSMNKSTFSELIELIYCFGADKNITWSEKATAAYAAVSEAA